jgi:hypothetical protein
MNDLSRIGALGFSHSGTRLGNVKLVSRVAMLAVTGCLLLFAEGCSSPDKTPSKAETPQEPSAEDAKQEATRLAKLQPLIDEQLEVGRHAANNEKWGEAAKAAAKVLKIDPDHAGAQELKRRATWGPLPEKTSGNLKYKEHPTEPVCAISGVVDRDAATIILPTQIEGRSVVRIGCEAFLDCWRVKSVTIPLSVTSIGDGAFYNCRSLKSMTIPSSVTSIGAYAFFDCDGLTAVRIPSSVTSIGEEAFAGCEELADLTIAEGNPSYQADGGVLFTKGGKTLLRYPKGKPGESYAIPPIVTRIGKRAFSGCYRLTSVTIPSSVTHIEEHAFSSCDDLTSVAIPSGVTSIGDYAFTDCLGLMSVTIPSSVTRIGELAFHGCVRLTSVTIPLGVTSIGEEAFAGCVRLTSVTIPSSVTSIGGYAFDGCESLISVTIPSSVTSIGDGVFQGCRDLTSVTIPSSVTSIGKKAFCSCDGLASVMIPPSVTSIGEGRLRAGAISRTSP